MASLKEQAESRAQQLLVERNEIEVAAQRERGKIFEGMLLRRHELVSKGVKLLKSHLLATEGMESEFHKAHYPDMPAPGEASDRDVLELQSALLELEGALDRISERCDSDGLCIALRALMIKSALKPRQFAEQIVTGPYALKQSDATSKDQMSVEQLLHFLGRRGISHTPPGLAFLLQKCNGAPDKPIKMDKFIQTLETQVAAPLVLGRLVNSLGIAGTQAS